MNDSDVISGDVWLNVHVEVEQWQVEFLDRVFLCGIFLGCCACSKFSMNGLYSGEVVLFLLYTNV